MNKTELVAAMAKDTNLSKKDVEDVLKSFVDVCEELGDVLLQIVLHSIIAQEEGLFTVEDVISGISRKMKFRHPKIFRPEDKEAAAMSWDELKREEHILREKLANKDRNA